MFITITALKLRSHWGFFRLSWLALKILRQTKTEKGFVVMKKTGFGRLHFTLTQWQTEEDLKRFSRSGAHLYAIKESSQLAIEIRTYTYPSEIIPPWPKAKELLYEKGKVIAFN